MLRTRSAPAPKPPQSQPPQHVALIMDGNGRWAQERGLPRLAGHRRGIETVREIITAASDAGVRHVTLYAFSSENWRRPEEEVFGLMDLFRLYLRRETAKLVRDGVRLHFIGDRAPLAADLRYLMEEAEHATRNGSRLSLHIAINYGARQEIVAAARRLAEQARDGALDPASIDEAAFADGLYTGAVPDPDLVIRTSGERRVSNFLLWQAAYSEFIFAPEYWPDFGRAAFFRALEDFAARDRRFGAVAPA